jgi:hypothetical protein
MSFTFKTSDKPIGTTKYDMQSLEEVFRESKVKEKILPNILMSSSGKSPVTRCSFDNGLVGSVVDAYNSHKNLVLRPDDFWCAILTQFSSYVNKNSEALRDRLVDFKGKKELTVTVAGVLDDAPYDKVTQLMTEEISKNIKDPSLRDWIVPSFSTTTDTDKVVCSIIMMATMQNFFNYRCCLRCGIPNVTLLGTLEDYINLSKRVYRLTEFDKESEVMKKWYQLLRPIMDQLITAANQKPDISFWQRICSDHEGGSGPSYISGWISAFACFDNDGNWQGDKFRVRTMCEDINSEYPIIDTNNIPSGIVSVPMVLDDNGQGEYNSILVAGSFAMSVLENGNTLAPRLDWCLSVSV